MNNAEFVKAPYEQLYADVFGVDVNYILPYIPIDVIDTIDWVFKKFPGFTERERELMRMRFLDGRSFRDCGLAFGVSYERARKIVARCIRKLRPARHNLYTLIMSNGIELYTQSKLEYESMRDQAKEELLRAIAESDEEINALRGVLNTNEKSLDLKNMPIEYCDFSVRTFNALIRSGVRNVGDLLNVSNYQLKNIRNMGTKSADEVREWLRRNNFMNAMCLRTIEGDTK